MLSAENNVNIRRKKRYNHVSISLRIKIDNDWKWIKALDWNEDGFNFYLDHELQDSNVLLKKGITQFCGNILWSRRSDDDNVVLEMILNALLFKGLEKLGNNKDFIHRIIKLIRAQGRLEEKKKLLAFLGLQVSDKKTELLIAKHKREHPMYRYGVKVESPGWTEIIQHISKTTSVVHVMDKIGKKLSALSKK